MDDFCEKALEIENSLLQHPRGVHLYQMTMLPAELNLAWNEHQ